MNAKLIRMLSTASVMLTATGIFGAPSKSQDLMPARSASGNTKNATLLSGANLYKLDPIAVQQEIQELNLLLQSVSKRVFELQQISIQALQKPQQKDIIQSPSSPDQSTVKLLKSDQKPTSVKINNNSATPSSASKSNKVASAPVVSVNPVQNNVEEAMPKRLEQKSTPKPVAPEVSPEKALPSVQQPRVNGDALIEGELRRALSVQRRTQAGENIHYKDEESDRIVPSWQSAYVPSDDSAALKDKQDTQRPKETALTEEEFLDGIANQRRIQAGEERQYISSNPDKEMSFTLPVYSEIKSSTKDRRPEQQREIQKSIDDLMAAMAAENNSRDNDGDWDDDDDDWLQY